MDQSGETVQETEVERILAFKNTLKDLTFNSKPHIIMLTELAIAEAGSDSAAAGIASVIENRIREVRNMRSADISSSSRQQKPAVKVEDMQMSLLYLIDSIVKNDKNPDHRYLNLFTQNIVSNFCEFFKRSDEKIRSRLSKLRGTWTGVFSDDKLSALDSRIKSLDPAWPVWPKAPGHTSAASTGSSSSSHIRPAVPQPNARSAVHAGNGVAASAVTGQRPQPPQQQVHFNRNFFNHNHNSEPVIVQQVQVQVQPAPISETQRIRQETLKRIEEQKAVRQQVAKRKQEQPLPQLNSMNRKKQKGGGRAGQGMRNNRGRNQMQQQQQQHQSLQQQEILPPVLPPVGMAAQPSVIIPSNPIYSRRPVVVQNQTIVPYEQDNLILQHQHQFIPQQTGGGAGPFVNGPSLAAASAVHHPYPYSARPQILSQAQVPPPHNPMMTSVITGTSNNVTALLSSLANSNTMNNSSNNITSGAGSSQTNPLQSVFDLLRLSNKTNEEANPATAAGPGSGSGGAAGAGASLTTAAATTAVGSGGPATAPVSHKRISPIPRMFRNEPPIEWTSESLRIPRKSISAMLYNGQQCSSCSERFKRHDDAFYRKNPEVFEADRQQYDNHVQWHYRQNNAQRNRSGKAAQSRPWYYKLSDWLLFKEINDELGTEQDKAFPDNAAGDAGSDEDEGDMRTVIARPDPADNVCNVCHEKFESQFREEDEQWILLNAVLHEDLVYHPSCLQDYLKNDHNRTDISEEQMETSILVEGSAVGPAAGEESVSQSVDEDKQKDLQQEEEETEKTEPQSQELDAQEQKKADDDLQQQAYEEQEILNFDADEEAEDEEPVESENHSSTSPLASGDKVPSPGENQPEAEVNFVVRGSEMSAACAIM